MTEGYELAFVIGGLFLSLSAFSLILGDNYLFRLGAAILGGAVAAYICVLLAESYFYPMIMEIADGTQHMSAAQMLGTAAAVIGVILLFCRAYTGSKTGGKIILTVLIAASAAVMVFGAAGGTIPSFIRSIAARFRLASLSSGEKENVWYWIRTCTVLVSAAAALFYTRHYDLGSRKEGRKGSSVFGNALIGFAFGALAAAVFLTAANILVDHVSGLIVTVQSLMK